MVTALTSEKHSAQTWAPRGFAQREGRGRQGRPEEPRIPQRVRQIGSSVAGAELAGEAAREAPSPAALPGRPSVDSRVLNDPVVDSHVLTAGTDTPALIGAAYVSLYAVDELVSQEKIKITGTRVERHGPHVRSHLDTVVAP